MFQSLLTFLKEKILNFMKVSGSFIRNTLKEKILNFKKAFWIFIKNTLKSRRFWLVAIFGIIALIVYALVTYLPKDSEFIEIYYSRTFYKFISQVISFMSGWFTFSLAEILIVSASIFSMIFLIVAIIKTIRNFAMKYPKPAKPILNFVTYALCLSFGLYSCFYILWGFNWKRQMVGKSLGYNMQEVYENEEELKELCKELATEINKLRPLVKENENGVMQINDSDSKLLERAYIGYNRLSKKYELFSGIYGNPKYLLSSKFYCYMKITGVFIPYTFEANVNKYTPDCSKPSTVLHEMAHQRGFTNEEEANFIAFLACREHKDIDYRYSGYYMAFIYSMNQLYSYNSDAYWEIYSIVCDGYKRDSAASNEFWKQFDNDTVEKVAESTNDSYIKANGDEDGVHSYGRVVNLLLAERRHRLSNGE